MKRYILDEERESWGVWEYGVVWEAETLTMGTEEVVGGEEKGLMGAGGGLLGVGGRNEIVSCLHPFSFDLLSLFTDTNTFDPWSYRLGCKILTFRSL